MGIICLNEQQHKEHLALIRAEHELHGSVQGFQRGFESLRRSQAGSSTLIRCLVHGTTMIEFHNPTKEHPDGFMRTFDGKVWEDHAMGSTMGKKFGKM